MNEFKNGQKVWVGVLDLSEGKAGIYFHDVHEGLIQVKFGDYRVAAFKEENIFATKSEAIDAMIKTLESMKDGL